MKFRYVSKKNTVEPPNIHFIREVFISIFLYSNNLLLICWNVKQTKIKRKSLSTTLVLFYVILLDLFFLKCEQKCLKVICVNSVQIIALHLCSQVIH